MKWFYTDPLAAAFMVKHFGIRLLVGNGRGYSNLHFSQLLTAAHMKKEVRWYVHEDSLHLLVPKVGDAMTNGSAVYLWHPRMTQEPADRIIQRYGLPFHYPSRKHDRMTPTSGFAFMGVLFSVQCGAVLAFSEWVRRYDKGQAR